MQFGAECTGVYYPRLLRDGWSLVERAEAGRWNAWTFFEKPLADGWTLRKIAHEQVDAPPGRGCYWDEHELRHDKAGVIASKHCVAAAAPTWCSIPSAAHSSSSPFVR
jgi:hypothetical protein